MTQPLISRGLTGKRRGDMPAGRVSLLRHRAAAGGRLLTRLVYSVRTLDDVIFREELERLAVSDPTLDVALSLTRAQPAGWSGFARRIDAAMLREVATPLGSPVTAYVCGPTLLVEAAADALIQIGFAPEHVLTERFGPTGT